MCSVTPYHYYVSPRVPLVLDWVMNFAMMDFPILPLGSWQLPFKKKYTWLVERHSP
nr:hypothetical protein Q903MT_gene925 [Picea sitchensis]